MKSSKPFNHVSMLEMCSERQFFTNHGLHLNGLGKEVMAKELVSLTYSLLNQKKNPPIVKLELRKHSNRYTTRKSTEHNAHYDNGDLC